ncbi:hypothetical protein V6C28_14615, partial [Enterococcus faecium]
MGRAMAARVKRAYWPTIGLILLSLIYVGITDLSLTAVVFLTILLLIIVASKNELFREQIIYSWEWLTVDGLITGTLSLLYIIIGVYNMPEFPHRKHHFISFFLFPSEKIWFSGLLAIIAVSFIIILLVHFLQGKKQQIGEPFNEERALSVLHTLGGNSDSQLIFLKDERRFIYEKDGQGSVLLQFDCYNNKCCVMGEPSGKKKDFAEDIDAFIKESARLC